MGGLRRALNKSQTFKKQTHSNPSFAKKPLKKPNNRSETSIKKGDSKYKLEANKKEQKKQDGLEIKQIKIKKEDIERNDIPFVIKPLSTQANELSQQLNSLIFKSKTSSLALSLEEAQDNLKDEIPKLNVLLKRIRDYYSPYAQFLDYAQKNQNQSKDENLKFKSQFFKEYNQFVIALLKIWLEGQSQQNLSKQTYKFYDAIKFQLQEIFSEDQVQNFGQQLEIITTSECLIDFVKQNCLKNIEHIKDLSCIESQQNQEAQIIKKILKTHLINLKIFIDIFQHPQCKLLDILINISSQIFTSVLDKIFLFYKQDNNILKNAINICNQVIKILDKQQKPSFSPSVNMFIVKTLKFMQIQSLTQDIESEFEALIQNYFKLINKSMPNNKVVTYKVLKNIEKSSFSILGKRQQQQSSIIHLEHLSLRKEYPNALASYNPHIEDEFQLKQKSKGIMDRKTLKIKTKKAEKDAIKELKKDTQFIQKLKLKIKK